MSMNCPPLKFLPTRGVVAVWSFLLAAQMAFGFEADTPVTPGASPEAQSLLTFFADTYGKHLLSGQQDGWRRSPGLSQELS